jgi:hypothetical protein
MIEHESQTHAVEQVQFPQQIEAHEASHVENTEQGEEIEGHVDRRASLHHSMEA